MCCRPAAGKPSWLSPADCTPVACGGALPALPVCPNGKAARILLCLATQSFCWHALESWSVDGNDSQLQPAWYALLERCCRIWEVILTQCAPPLQLSSSAIALPGETPFSSVWSNCCIQVNNSTNERTLQHHPCRILMSTTTMCSIYYYSMCALWSRGQRADIWHLQQRSRSSMISSDRSKLFPMVLHSCSNFVSPLGQLYYADGMQSVCILMKICLDLYWKWQVCEALWSSVIHHNGFVVIIVKCCSLNSFIDVTMNLFGALSGWWDFFNFQVINCADRKCQIPPRLLKSG